MRHTHFLIATMALAAVAASCTEEVSEKKNDRKAIHATVRTNDGTQVKSGADSWIICEDLPLEAEGLDLTLSAVVSMNRELPFVDARTKGTILTTENLSRYVSSFRMRIPAADNLQDVVVAAEGDGWAVQPENGRKAEWPADRAGQYIDFYAYTGGTLDKSTPTKFSYRTNSRQASEQEDLLYTHTKAKENDVEIEFFHALAAVRFVVGELKPNFEVKSISIKNIADSGTGEHLGGDQFKWVLGASRTVFSQSYTRNTHRPASGNAVTFFDNEVSSTFFIIPQAVDEVSFEIMISDGVNIYPVEAKVPAVQGGWKAGYFYTYSVSGGEGKVDVDVVEAEFENGVSLRKSDVGARNTGKLASYIRAAVVGNWYNDKNKVVAPWAETITPKAGSGWVAGADGFYYYVDPVMRDAATAALLDSYTVPESPVAGAHLELNVLVQAVEYDAAKSYVGSAWGGEADALHIIDKK